MILKYVKTMCHTIVINLVVPNLAPQSISNMAAGRHLGFCKKWDFFIDLYLYSDLQLKQVQECFYVEDIEF